MWIAACGSDSGTTGPGPTSTSPVGNYALSTLNGKNLPVALYPPDPNFLWEVTAGTVALRSDGKYSVVTTSRQTIPGNVETFVDSLIGTWVLAGTTITLTDSQDGSTGQITWASNQLMFAIKDGSVTNTYVYTKK
jgi:hypothetical protein